MVAFECVGGTHYLHEHWFVVVVLVFDGHMLPHTSYHGCYGSCRYVLESAHVGLSKTSCKVVEVGVSMLSGCDASGCAETTVVDVDKCHGDSLLCGAVEYWGTVECTHKVHFEAPLMVDGCERCTESCLISALCRTSSTVVPNEWSKESNFVTWIMCELSVCHTFHTGNNKGSDV